MNVGVPVAPAAHRAAQQRLELYAGCDHIEVRRGDGWFAVASGVASNDMNGVVTSTPSALPDRIVDDLFGWFAERALPASWLTAVPDPRLTAMLVERGAQPERSGWWAGRQLHAATSRREPSGVTIMRVRAGDDLERWLDIAAACGWVQDEHDRATRGELYRHVGLEHPALAHWIAVQGATAIGMASSFIDGDIIDLCGLAVIDAERRRGIGTALIERRLHQASEQAVRNAVAALSPDGWALYQQLGFTSTPAIADTWFYLPLTQA